MRFTKVWMKLVPVAVGMLLISAVAMNQSTKSMHTDTVKTAVQKKQIKSQYWTCTMHPEIHKKEPGNCPICGMKLVFRESDTADTTKTKSKDTIATKNIDRTKNPATIVFAFKQTILKTKKYPQQFKNLIGVPTQEMEMKCSLYIVMNRLSSKHQWHTSC